MEDVDSPAYVMSIYRRTALVFLLLYEVVWIGTLSVDEIEEINDRESSSIS